VAGGPSAASFDFARLGERVLSVNDAALKATALTAKVLPLGAVFSADPRWVGRHRSFLAAYRGEKYAALALDTYPELAGIPGMVYLQRAHFTGLAEDPEFLAMGGNSGYAAINLAVHKRAKEIHLVGYDMDPADGEKYRQWAPRFKTMLPQLVKRGIKVVNHSMVSSIDAFPKEP
jgi:SAM-dependent methyltransferase